MIDGSLSRAVGAPLPIKLGKEGKRFLLRPFSLDDIGAIEQAILAERKSPLTIAKEQVHELPAELRRDFLADALKLEAEQLKDYISPEAFVHFIDTRPGACLTLFLMLRREQPNITLDEVEALVAEMGDQEFRRLLALREQVSGTDELGNSCGPSQTELARPEATETAKEAAKEADPGGHGPSEESASATRA